jgi:predicted TIM-barrel enzyme
MTNTTTFVEPRPDALLRLFEIPKPVIGTIHVLPTPGAPRYRGQPMREVITRAVDDATRFVQGGIDGIIVENEGDIPFRKPEDIGPETVAAHGSRHGGGPRQRRRPDRDQHPRQRCASEPGHRSSCRGVFVRVNQWANAYVANEGYIEGAAAEALRFRHSIDADDISILADVHVKHGSHAIVSDRSIADMTHDVEAFDADILIATGQRTGDPTRLEEVEDIKKVASRPVLVGSGLDAANAATLMTAADGAIVGSAMKVDGVWWNSVDVGRVETIVNQVAGCR